MPLSTDALLQGRVLDQDGQPIVGAELTLTDGRGTVTSGEDGTYRVLVPASSPAGATLQVVRSGFVKQTVRSTFAAADAGVTTNVVLQKQAPTVTVAMPLPAEPPAQVASNGNDGAATLLVPAGSLVDAAGQPVTGAVDVALTYFHPRQPRRTMPLDLYAVAEDASSPEPLTTFGMAEIEISQNGALLQVAPGSHLPLKFSVMEAQKTYVADHMVDPNYLPRLYYADMEQGLWVEQGTLDGDTLAYDANSRMFTANLPHMSSWNIDSLDYGRGGCMQGVVNQVDSSGASVPAANKAIRVWLPSRDEVGFFDVSTDASGRYCIEPGVSKGAPTNMIRYFVSSREAPNDTSMCNPLPVYCSTCVDTTIAHDCQSCGLRDDVICNDTAPYGNYDLAYNVDGYAGCNARVACTTASSTQDLLGRCVVVSGGARVPAYQDSCQPALRTYATLKAGAHCGSDSCFVAAPVTVGGTPSAQPTKPTPTTTPSTTPKTPQPTTPPPAQVTCGTSNVHTKYLGDPCTLGVDTCCPLSANLVCADRRCVPNNGT